MSESRRGAIDARLNGDHEQFIKVFDEALKKGEEKDVDSVWGMMSYFDKLKEHLKTGLLGLGFGRFMVGVPCGGNKKWRKSLKYDRNRN